MPGRIAQKFDGFSGHALDIADRQEISRLSMNDDLGQSADIGSDDRDAAVHRFESRQAEALLLAGQKEQVGAEKEGLQLVLFPEEMDVGGEAHLLRQLLDMRPLGAVADQEELGLAPLPDPGIDPDDVSDP